MILKEGKAILLELIYKRFVHDRPFLSLSESFSESILSRRNRVNTSGIIQAKQGRVRQRTPPKDLPLDRRISAVRSDLRIYCVIPVIS